MMIEIVHNETDETLVVSRKAFHLFYKTLGYFGGFLRKDGFGLNGGGIFFIDKTQNKIELSGETPLPLIISLPLGFIPVVGRAMRTFYRPSKSFSFQSSEVSELVRRGRDIQFKAPKYAGGRLKRVEFTTETEPEAREIEEAIRQLNSAVTPSEFLTILHTGWLWLKLGFASAALLVGLFLIVLAGARVMRFRNASYEHKVNLERFYSTSVLHRMPKTVYEQTLVYPDAAKGLFQRGGFVCIDATFAPDGNATDVKVTDEKDEVSKGITKTSNPALVEAAMNSARQIKFDPGNGEVKVQFLYKFYSRYDAAFPPPL